MPGWQVGEVSEALTGTTSDGTICKRRGPAANFAIILAFNHWLKKCWWVPLVVQALHCSVIPPWINHSQSITEFLVRVIDKFTGYYNVSIATLVLNVGAEVTHRCDIQPSFGNQGLCLRWGEGCVCTHVWVCLCVCTHAHTWQSVPGAEKDVKGTQDGKLQRKLPRPWAAVCMCSWPSGKPWVCVPTWASRLTYVLSQKEDV